MRCVKQLYVWHHATKWECWYLLKEVCYVQAHQINCPEAHDYSLKAHHSGSLLSHTVRFSVSVLQRLNQLLVIWCKFLMYLNDHWNADPQVSCWQIMLLTITQQCRHNSLVGYDAASVVKRRSLYRVRLVPNAFQHKLCCQGLHLTSAHSRLTSLV